MLGDDDDVDRLGAFEQRHGVGDGARGGAAAVPAHHHPFEREPLLLDVGHDDHRPPGLEQRSLDHQFLGGALLGLRLADHRDVEAPRDPAERVAAPARLRVDDARYRCHAGLLGGRLEPAHGGVRGLGVLFALDLDQVGGDAAEHGVRDHRVVDERDAGDMRAEGLGNRDRIVGGEVLRGSRPTG